MNPIAIEECYGRRASVIAGRLIHLMPEVPVEVGDVFVTDLSGGPGKRLHRLRAVSYSEVGNR